MAGRVLTRDNPPLSRPKNAHALVQVPARPRSRAIDCIDHDEAIVRFLRASLSENTRRAYRSDLAHFLAWGGRIPATDRLVASYLAVHAGELSVATLGRRLVAISRAHQARGLPNAASSPLVRATLHGIRRTFGIAQKQAKPLLAKDIARIVGRMGTRPKDVRDRALLLIGFAGGFRPSELVALDSADIERRKNGIIVHIRRSKTDQVGAGRKIGIPFGSRLRSCPVMALDRWLARSRATDGAVFRLVDRHGNISARRMSGEAVSLVVRERLTAAGIGPAGYSGHSLRAGFVTSAALAGVPSWKIRRQTGHKSEKTLDGYIRDEIIRKTNANSLL